MNLVCIGCIHVGCHIILSFRLMSLRRHNDVKMSYVNDIIYGDECFFQNKALDIKRYARKRIKRV